MTEEYNGKNLKQEEDETRLTDAVELDQEERQSRLIKNIHGIAQWIALAVGFFYLSIFFQSRQWQVFTVGFITLASSLLFFSSFNAIRNDKKDQADTLFLTGLLLFFSGTEMLFSEFTIVNLIVLGISSLVYLFFARPRRIWQWISATFIIALVILITRVIQFPRIPIASTSQFHSTVIPVTALLVIIIYLVVQTVRNTQRVNLTVRLIIGFTIVSLVPLLIISTINGSLNFTQSQNTVEEKLELISSLTFNEISHWVEDAENILNTGISTGQMNAFNKLMEDPDSLENPENTYQNIKIQLNQIKNNNEVIDDIFLMDASGRVIISTLNDMEGTDISSEDFYVNGITGFYIQDPQFMPQFDDIVAYAALPLIQTSSLSFGEGRPIGMIAAQLNMHSLFTFFEEVNTLSDSVTIESYLVNSDRILISPSRFIGFELGNSVITTTAIERSITEEISGLGEYTTYHNNDQVIGVFRWIPEIKAVLITEQSRQEAFAPARQTILVNFVIAVMGGGAAFLIGWINTVNISRPIHRLAEVLKAITEGDLSQKVEIEREDQLGQLGISVNEMTIQLRDSIENLEETVTERTEELERRAQYLQAAAEVGQASAQFYSLDDLLIPVTHLISERFEFYHVGIFMIDENKEFAVLQAANSDGGWRMLARGHKLRIGEEGIVGYVTSTGKPRVQQQVGTDEIYFDNPDLPLTRSEMTLPLEASGELFGALDVQSTEENAFSEEDVSVLQVLANQVALSIYNARLFDQLQTSVEAERRVFGELSREAWAALLKGRTGLNIQSTAASINTLDERLSPEARQAINEKKAIQTARGTDAGYSLAIPIKVHGNVVIGLIETNKPAGAGPWLIQEIAVMESISEQLGIALENARLFDETQRLAYRERIAADVAGKVWASSDIETILQTTVEELSRALNASHGAIRLSFTETEDESSR